MKITINRLMVEDRERFVQYLHDTFHMIEKRHGVKMTIVNGYTTQECVLDRQLMDFL